MNPLDLAGPAFLVFYGAVGLVTVARLWLRRRTAESGEAPRVDLSEPYLIACLRGGKNEVLRVASVGLIDRGLLEAGLTSLRTVRAEAIDAVQSPVEKALAAPRDEAARAGLTPAQCEALARIDTVGLALAAESFARKRLTAANAHRLRVGWGSRIAWVITGIERACATKSCGG